MTRGSGARIGLSCNEDKNILTACSFSTKQFAPSLVNSIQQWRLLEINGFRVNEWSSKKKKIKMNKTSTPKVRRKGLNAVSDHEFYIIKRLPIPGSYT